MSSLLLAINTTQTFVNVVSTGFCATYMYIYVNLCSPDKDTYMQSSFIDIPMSNYSPKHCTTYNVLSWKHTSVPTELRTTLF